MVESNCVPKEFLLLKSADPLPYEICPKCNKDFVAYNRGCIQRNKRTWFFMKQPYCAIICSSCYEIIAWENPPIDVGDLILDELKKELIKNKIKFTKKCFLPQHPATPNVLFIKSKCDVWGDVLIYYDYDTISIVVELIKECGQKYTHSFEINNPQSLENSISLIKSTCEVKLNKWLIIKDFIRTNILRQY